MRLNQGGAAGSNASARSIARFGPSTAHAARLSLLKKIQDATIMLNIPRQSAALIFRFTAENTDRGRPTVALYSGPLSSPSASFWYGAGTAPDC